MGLTTAEVRRRIVKRFEARNSNKPFPDHLVMHEVPIDGLRRLKNGRTIKVQRRIDCVAVGLRSASKYLVHGFEIKVTRSDLLAELREPEKCLPAMEACDRFWLVLGDKDILREGDRLPVEWGVLVPRGKNLVAIAQPTALTGARNNRIWSQFLASSLRSHGVCRGLGVVEGWQKGYRTGLSHGRNGYY